MTPPRSRTRFGVAVLVVLLASASLGCSKNDTTSTTDSSATPTTAKVPLTKEQYVAQANAICKVAKDESDKLDQELRVKYPDPRAIPEDTYQLLLKEAVARLLPHYKKELADLRTLTPPTGDEGLITKGVVTIEGAVTAMEADPDALASPALRGYQEGYDYGLSECFSPTAKTFETIGEAIS